MFDRCWSSKKSCLHFLCIVIVQLTKLKEKLIKEDNNRKELENLQTELMQEKQQLFIQLQRVIARALRINYYCGLLIVRSKKLLLMLKRLLKSLQQRKSS